MNRKYNQLPYSPLSRRRESAATLVEYAVVTGLLIGAFVLGAALLTSGSQSRGNSSVGTAKEMVPCGPGSPLSGDECL